MTSPPKVPSGYSEKTENDRPLPAGFDIKNAKILQPLTVGRINLKHGIVHAPLGRSRGFNGEWSKLDEKYFEERATDGGLIISSATTGSPESIWPYGIGLFNKRQQDSYRKIIDIVHAKGGIFFVQLLHPGRAGSPALVKWAANKYKDFIDYELPEGYKALSSSASKPESGFNTHSGELFDNPHEMTIEEIERVKAQYKKAAILAKEAGADGIEIQSGSGFLLDQFLHDNINQRTDQYGGSIENRARFPLEVIEEVASVFGYQRIGVHVSPFSYFHETDGSQPLEQVLYLSRKLAEKGVGYISITAPRVSRNLDVQENLKRLKAKGISSEDLSFLPLRKLLKEVKTVPGFTPTRLFGVGGFTRDSCILAVEEGEADAIIFGRRFIANPDLVERVKNLWDFQAYDRSTFYSHGYKGYLTYPKHGETFEPKPIEANGPVKKVAIIGAGVSGIVSANALSKFPDFELKIFERLDRPGGVWNFDETPSDTPVFPAETPQEAEGVVVTPEFTDTLTQKLTRPKFTSSPVYRGLKTNIPGEVMSGGGFFKLPEGTEDDPYIRSEQLIESIHTQSRVFDKIIQYNTSVENVEKRSGRFELTLKRFKLDEGTETWYKEEFDNIIVANGHNHVPRIPKIPGLDNWNREKIHGYQYRDAKFLKGKKTLVVGSSETGIDIVNQSLETASSPILVSEKYPHPRFPNIFKNREDEVVVFPEIQEIKPGNVIVFKDGQTVDNVDVIVFATGYFHVSSFLDNVRPKTNGSYIPDLYQHVFDIHNPEIAFIGLASLTLTYMAWEKSAFIAGLAWSKRIELPPVDEQRKWVENRLAEKGPSKFHLIGPEPSERVLYFVDLNYLAKDYLNSDNFDDELMGDFKTEWSVTLARSRPAKAKYYRIRD